jgi:hypothetical protein
MLLVPPEFSWKPRKSANSKSRFCFLCSAASFAAFLFALSPRLYCEGVDEMVMGDIISD